MPEADATFRGQLVICELGGRNRASLKMHWEAAIERVWRCTWRPQSSEFGDALGGRNRASLDEYWEAALE